MLNRTSVDSINDYNGFSPRRLCEVDRVYLTFLFKVNFLLNCSIYFSVLQAACVFTDRSAKINTHIC